MAVIQSGHALSPCDMLHHSDYVVHGNWVRVENVDARLEAALPAGPHLVEDWSSFRCYTNVTSPWMTRSLASLFYSWQPTHCRLRPFVSDLQLQLPKALSRLGPVLLVGDSLLEQLSVAMQHLCKLSHTASYHKAFVMVNSYTLSPMGIGDLKKCQEKIPIARMNGNASYVPCPIPVEQRKDGASKKLSGYHQQLDSMNWTQTLQANAAKTVVFNTGHHFWKEKHFATKSCGHNLSDAFKFNRGGYSGDCDVFGVQYPLMAKNIARYFATATEVQRVVFLTSPPGVPECNTYTSPGPPSTSPPKDKWFHWQDVARAESIWPSAFQTHAPNISFTVLNVSKLSEERGDAHPQNECLHFCNPGVPSTWTHLLSQTLVQLAQL